MTKYTLKYCQLCLVINAKTFIMTAATLEAYSMLLRLPLHNKEPYICYECSALLLKYQEFHARCIRAHNVLTHFKMKNLQVIPHKDFEAQRQLHNLESKLSVLDVKYEVDDLENEPLLNIKNCKELANIGTEKDETVELNKEINTREETSTIEEFVDTSIGDFHDDTVVKEENDTFGRKDNEALSNTDHNKTVKKTQVTNKQRKKRNQSNAFFEGFATVVPLTAEAARNEVLMRKETSNYLKSAYKCELCYKGFMGKTSFDNHMKKHTEEFGLLECKFCYLRFATRKLQTQHTTELHSRKISCNLCNYVTCCVCQAKAHISMHKGKQYVCDECDATYRQYSTLQAHKRKVHATECVCELCGCTFGKERGLYCHKRKLHRKEPPPLTGPYCAECAVQFATESAYKRHLVLSAKHKDAPIRNGCKFCGATFPDEKALKAHVLQHTRKPRRYYCYYCSGTRFSSLEELKAHIASQHSQGSRGLGLQFRGEGTYICEYCGKGFDKFQIRYHLMKHTRAPFKCEECGKAFVLATKLASHKESHSARRPHPCRSCPKSYKTKNALKAHLRTHTGTDTNACAPCDKSFLRLDELNAHALRAHEPEAPAN